MSRPKDRHSSAGLLPCMEARLWADGKTVTYRFKPKGRPWVTLGTDRAAAIRSVAERLGLTDDFGTLRWVWAKYQTTRRWLRLADGTRADYEGAAKQLLAVFGHMQVASIRTTDIARYVHVYRAQAPRRANVEKTLLSNLFGCAITLGVCERNATDGVQPHPEEPRTRAVEPELLAKFAGWLSTGAPQRRVIGLAAEFISLTGSRKVEFLPLTDMQVDHQAGVVRTVRAKQRGAMREQIVEAIDIDDGLRALLERIQANREAHAARRKAPVSPYLFPTRDGNAYTARGFKSAWQRGMQDALAEGVITAADRFTFHDLRAYFVMEHKRQREKLPPLHRNEATTARVYDRTRVVKRRSL